jgi:hypothetical protein
VENAGESCAAQRYGHTYCGFERVDVSWNSPYAVANPDTISIISKEVNVSSSKDERKSVGSTGDKSPLGRRWYIQEDSENLVVNCSGRSTQGRQNIAVGTGL